MLNSFFPKFFQVYHGGKVLSNGYLCFLPLLSGASNLIGVSFDLRPQVWFYRQIQTFLHYPRADSSVIAAWAFPTPTIVTTPTSDTGNGFIA
jgi:hypothetical protein